MYTLGKRGSSGDFHTTPEQLRLQGAEVHTADRGGEVTYHGPGQARPDRTPGLQASAYAARKSAEALLSPHLAHIA